MYAICNVIFGTPLNRNDNRPSSLSLTVEQMLENEDSLFCRYYHGAADDYEPSAFGVELTRFDECVHHTDLRSLPLEPTPEQITEYYSEFNKLPEEVQEEIQKKFGDPTVFILWSTS